METIAMPDKKKIAESVKANVGDIYYARALELLLNDSRESAERLLCRSGVGVLDAKAALDYEEEAFLLS
jgi:hypothetical protein